MISGHVVVRFLGVRGIEIKHVIVVVYKIELKI